ncbi:sigma 54-interacting transcriptional regulator, partial [Pseudomonas aeruginosa]
LAQRVIRLSPASLSFHELMGNLGATSDNVLVLGETGARKGLVARGLHASSRGHQHVFVALNCGGLPKSFFVSEIFGHEAHA